MPILDKQLRLGVLDIDADGRLKGAAYYFTYTKHFQSTDTKDIFMGYCEELYNQIKETGHLHAS